VGWEKWRAGAQKHGNISETRKDRGKVAMESLYKKVTNALSNGTIPDPLRPPLPQIWGFVTPPQKTQSLLSQKRLKLRTSNLAGIFTGSIQTIKNFGNKRSVGVSRDCPIFWVPPIISGTGNTTNFQFCMHIRSIDRNKSPLQISGKVAVGVVRTVDARS